MKKLTTLLLLLLIMPLPSLYAQNASCDQAGLPENESQKMVLRLITNEYCPAWTINQQEYISGVSLGNINIGSGWQDSIADYTVFQTGLTELWPEQITVSIANSRPNDSVFVWIDWNQDFIFETGNNEEYILANETGSWESFTGFITVPGEAPTGIHRMRIRLTYNSTPEPCGDAEYGEIEDYSVDVFTIPENDIGVEEIRSPWETHNIRYDMITIRIKNFGSATQSNFPVSYILEGGTEVFGMVKGPLLTGETFDFTFNGFAYFCPFGTNCTLNACTMLPGDQTPDNDCYSLTIVNDWPFYCDCSTTVEDEYIANVSFGSINNSSVWWSGVADYTDQYTIIGADSSENITVLNGNAWASDKVYVWIDWNEDLWFEEDSPPERYILNNVGGAGEMFTGNITVPSGQKSGDYRMRIRMTYSSIPFPYGNSTYGEVEDYTIIVEATTPPEINLNPKTINQELFVGQILSQAVSISNPGDDTLTFDISLN
nr:hypothetical protein [Bacteroidota bacterium]